MCHALTFLIYQPRGKNASKEVFLFINNHILIDWYWICPVSELVTLQGPIFSYLLQDIFIFFACLSKSTDVSYYCFEDSTAF